MDLDKGKRPMYKNVPIKMPNKGIKFYEPYASIAPESSKFDLHSNPSHTSHISSGDSYNQIGPYFEKPYLLHVCFIDEDLEKIQKENPVTYALRYPPYLSHFPVIATKNRYYYELILFDIGFCSSHKFRGDDRSHHQIPYNYEKFESCITYSKAIITKVMSYEDNGSPNAMRKISNVILAQGIPYEYNYWDYICKTPTLH